MQESHMMLTFLRMRPISNGSLRILMRSAAVTSTGFAFGCKGMKILIRVKNRNTHAGVRCVDLNALRIRARLKTIAVSRVLRDCLLTPTKILLSGSPLLGPHFGGKVK